MSRSPCTTPFWHLGLGFHPVTQLVQVGQTDITVAHTIYEVVAYSRGKPGPRLDLRHHSPKMKRPISLPNRLTSLGSVSERNRSARAKNAFSFSSCASSPC